MGRFASETTVSVERSRAEIEETLRRYGATAFHSGWEEKQSAIGFRIAGLYVRFVLPFPNKTDRRFTHKKVRGYEQKMSQLQSDRAYEQEMRSRWRALLLVVKAKLEAVECKISTVENEFLAYIVVANQMTIGEILACHMPAIKEGRMPSLMLPAADVPDAEFTTRNGAVEP